MQIDSSVLGDQLDEKYRILDDDGSILPDRTVPDVSDETLVTMYSDMAFARHFDERAVSLQRQGRMGTYPPVAGHEGAQIGSTYALADEDWILPTYRESAACLARGVPPSQVLRYWMGYEEANVHLTNQRMFPFNIGVGALVPHAAGMGMAFARGDNDRVALCHFGDGATSEGDFHEGLNFAGVFDAPTVFFCNNNQWAISVPRERQTASETIVQKALAYGVRGVRVDGMDPLAVYEVTREAVERARDGDEGSRTTLVEAVQYRLGAHTTADDPSAYRDEEEVERWKRKDPVERFERFLLETGRIDEERIDALEAEHRERVADAIEAAEDGADPDPDAIFKHAFAEPTERLDAQCEWLARFREEHGDDVIAEGEG
jgi:pyruvate dehydrogenase E1 component alpha subunit